MALKRYTRATPLLQFGLVFSFFRSILDIIMSDINSRSFFSFLSSYGKSAGELSFCA